MLNVNGIPLIRIFKYIFFILSVSFSENFVRWALHTLIINLYCILVINWIKILICLSKPLKKLKIPKREGPIHLPMTLISWNRTSVFLYRIFKKKLFYISHLEYKAAEVFFFNNLTDVAIKVQFPSCFLVNVTTGTYQLPDKVLADWQYINACCFAGF